MGDRTVHLALGTPVVYTQLAAVARKGMSGMWNRGWFLPEKGNGTLPHPVVFKGVSESSDDLYHAKLARIDSPFAPTEVRFVDGSGKELSPASIEKFNKATVTWDASGSGVVCGLMTKLYGVSHRGKEDESGWLEHYGRVKLYVVRAQLEGREFAFVPSWAIKPVVHANV